VASTDSILPHSSSVSDTGLSKRPRDARLIHMILASLGVTSYQERVPIQMLDFCYRYTSSTLQDALHLTSEFGQNVTGTGKISATNVDLNLITLQSLKLSIASRTHYQFSPTLPKPYLTDLASEKNKVALPTLGKDWGLRLPPERYCLTGVGFGLKEEWDSEGEEDVDMGNQVADAIMTEDLDEDGEGEDGDDNMDDVFGSTGEPEGLSEGKDS